MDWLSCFPMEWLSEVLLLKGVNGELVSAFVYSERGIVEKFWGGKKKDPFQRLLSSQFPNMAIFEERSKETATTCNTTFSSL